MLLAFLLAISAGITHASVARDMHGASHGSHATAPHHGEAHCTGDAASDQGRPDLGPTKGPMAQAERAGCCFSACSSMPGLPAALAGDRLDLAPLYRLALATIARGAIVSPLKRPPRGAA